MGDLNALSIFNKNGNKLELSYNKEYDILQGIMYLPEVSTDLIENETLFILEETGGEFIQPKSFGDLTVSLMNSMDYQIFTVGNPHDEFPKVEFIDKKVFNVEILPPQSIKKITNGRLYNWYAITNTRKLAPTGWRVPSRSDWETLVTFLAENGYNYDGSITTSFSNNKVAKALASKEGWNILPSTYVGSAGYNSSLNNSSGMNLYPSGVQVVSGSQTASNAMGRVCGLSFTDMGAYGAVISNGNSFSFSTPTGKHDGMSCRLIKEDGVFVESVIIDGDVYHCVKHGNQVWLQENLAVEHYSDGTQIGSDFIGTNGAVTAYNGDENNVYIITTVEGSGNIRKPFRVDFAVKSSTEKTVIDKLLVYSALIGRIIAEISVYIEVVGEDERLTAKLADFGEYITANEEYIFRNSDIKEELTNHILLNEKKKEFILEMHNIKPYFSAYKGLINILNLFDYPDLTLKEYWVDIKTGKYIAEDIKLYEQGRLDETIRYNSQLKKTSFFGLYYPINHTNGEYTQDGLPETVDSFMFSNEEIIIKLFGLKNWIKDREIGGISSIIDIIGEITYFNKYDINFWYDDWNLISESISQDNIRFSINGVEDNNIINVLLSDLSGFTFDTPISKVGAVINVKNLTFGVQIQDVDVTFEQLKTENATYSIFFNNVDKFKYYQIEWSAVSVKTGLLVDSKIGKLDDLLETTLTLPNSGLFNIQMKLYKFNNEMAVLTKHSIINVSPKSISLTAFVNTSEIINQTPEYIALFDTYAPKTLKDFRKIKFVDDDFMAYANHKFMFFDNIQFNDIISQTFQTYGQNFNPDKDLLPFAKGMTKIFTDNVAIHVSDTIFFNLKRSQFVGKSNANWKLLDENGTVIVELDNYLFFCYTFFKSGKYSLQVTLYNNKGDNKTELFSNYITVHKYKIDY